MNKLALLLLVMVLAVGLSSCGLYRRITGRRTRVAVVDSTQLAGPDTAALKTPDSGLVKLDTAQLPSIRQPDDSLRAAALAPFLPLWNTRLSWTTFSGNAKTQFEGKGESHEFTAHIRLQKDKAIWISVTALLNFEVARVLITPDTIQIQNKLQKELKTLPFSEAGTLLPIPADFSSLQQLIVGELIQTGHLPSQLRDSAGIVLLGFISPELTQTASFQLADSLLRFQSIITPSSSITCSYASWGQVNGNRFANERTMSMTDKGDAYVLTLEFTSAAFDTPVEMPFNIPGGYKRN